ncbi:MAG TPA: DMT family transporter [bacterium]|nr:DMT family transporter [bacterium]
MTEPSPSDQPSGLLGQISGNVQGIALMVFSTACMACMYVAIREVPGGMHPFEVAFFRNLIAVLLLAAWHRQHFLACFRTEHVRLHILRGSLNVTAMLAFFYAVLITPLATVAALGFTAPLFASVLAIFVLRERLQWHRLSVIALGFAGALLILRPGVTEVSRGPVLLLASSAIWAVTIMVIKVLARTDSSTTITVYMGTVMAPLSLLAAAFFWQWPDGAQLLWLLLIAVLGTLGQLSLAQSFRLADVGAVLPLDFLKLVWGTLLGFFIFAEVPDVFTWVGGSMIFGSTTYLALRESRRTALPAPANPSAAVPR